MVWIYQKQLISFHYVPQNIQNITIALSFLLVENLHLSGVMIKNNSGYGLGTLNLLGNSSIIDSVFHINNSLFSDNQRDAEVVAFHGANLAVTAIYPEGNSTFHSIVIDNCRIEGGRAALGGGMSLLASESIYINYPQAFCTAIDIDQASGVQIINTEIIIDTKALTLHTLTGQHLSLLPF